MEEQIGGKRESLVVAVDTCCSVQCNCRGVAMEAHNRKEHEVERQRTSNWEGGSSEKYCEAQEGLGPLGNHDLSERTSSSILTSKAQFSRPPVVVANVSTLPETSVLQFNNMHV